MTTRQLLEDARKLVEAGWTKGKLVEHRPDGQVRYCVFGALGYARAPFTTGDYCDRMNAGHDLLQAALPAGRLSTIGYNDDPTTTHADVLALFDRAIALCPADAPGVAA